MKWYKNTCVFVCACVRVFLLELNQTFLLRNGIAVETVCSS